MRDLVISYNFAIKQLSYAHNNEINMQNGYLIGYFRSMDNMYSFHVLSIQWMQWIQRARDLWIYFTLYNYSASAVSLKFTYKSKLFSICLMRYSSRNIYCLDDDCNFIDSSMKKNCFFLSTAHLSLFWNLITNDKICYFEWNSIENK